MSQKAVEGIGKGRIPRGRPTLKNPRNLSQDLIAAVEAGLRQKCHLDLTNREIASAAGTHAGMIHYYYDGKEGLIDAALDQFSRDVADVLARLRERFEVDCKDANSIILREWIDLHRRHRGISSIVMIESFRPFSPIINYYRSRKAKGTFPKMQELVGLLVDKGYYKPNADVEMAAFTILSMVHSPMIIGMIIDRIGHVADHLVGDLWIDQAVRMLNSEFCAE